MASDDLVCPVLVGRDGPSARLRSLVDEVASGAARQPADGSRRIALVAGKAGLGKSRLVAETVAHARARGFRVLAGACFPQDRASPFAPIVDLLRAALNGLPPDEAPALVRPFARESGAATAGPGSARGAAGLPSRCGPGARPPPVVRGAGPLPARRFPRSSSPLSLARERGASLGVPRGRLSRARAGGWRGPPRLPRRRRPPLVRRRQPGLPRFLARRRPGRQRQPLLILATCRAEDAEPALRGWLAQLDRARLATRSCWPRSAVTRRPDARGHLRRRTVARRAGGRHLRADRGQPVQDRGADRGAGRAGEAAPAERGSNEGGIWRWSARPSRSGGCRAACTGRVRERVASVGPAARELADAGGRRRPALRLRAAPAAGPGRRADAAGAGQGAGRRAADRRGVPGPLRLPPRPDPPGDLRRAAGARARWRCTGPSPRPPSSSYADSLDPPPGRPGLPFLRGEAWQKALAYAQQAAERAQRLYAPRAAVEHFTRARGHRGVPTPDRTRRAEARSPRSTTSAVGPSSDRRRASRHRRYERAALDFAHQAGDRRAEWQALIDLGSLWASRDYARAGPCLIAALELARSLGDAAPGGPQPQPPGELADQRRPAARRHAAAPRGDGDLRAARRPGTASPRPSTCSAWPPTSAPTSPAACATTSARPR